MGFRCTLRLMSTGSISAAGTGLATMPETMVPEKSKHVSAQPAMEPQSLPGFFSHGLPCGQQSSMFVCNDFSSDSASTDPPAIGSRATDKATKTTTMVRPMFMVRTDVTRVYRAT